MFLQLHHIKELNLLFLLLSFWQTSIHVGYEVVEVFVLDPFGVYHFL